MMIPSITEGLIRQNATAESFRRGQEYFAEGAVISLAKRGNALEAEVEGSEPEPYDVRIEFDEAGIWEADCSCPYDWGGWCKHIVAVLLAYIDQPETIEERPTIESLLSSLDRDQLQTLLQRLVESKPSLADEVESQVSLLQVKQVETPVPKPAGPRVRQTSVDTGSFRRQVRSILHSLDRMSSSEAYWHVGAVVNEIRPILDQASAFAEAGDGRSALAILEAVTDEYLKGWEILDDSDGDASALFDDLGQAMTKAFLSIDLDTEERHVWAAKLTEWTEVLGDYGAEEAFDAALQAVEQGWDFPPLQQVLRGEHTEDAVSRLMEFDWKGELTSARLEILERQGRHEEYLNLARAAGLVASYTTMLVKLGRIDEAIAKGLQSLTSAEDALALAKQLREAGALEEALRIGEHGLDLQGHAALLAEWLVDVASGLGQTALALRAAQVVFYQKPSLVTYGRVQELAGDRWPEYRAQMLDHLRQTKSAYGDGPIDVLLHEGLVADAIALVERGAFGSGIARVVDAAIASHPDWVIATCRRHAEGIMNGGKANYYADAVSWLAKARQAYYAAGREAEWRQYRQELLALHSRKYKLVPMLKALKD